MNKAWASPSRSKYIQLRNGYEDGGQLSPALAANRVANTPVRRIFLVLMNSVGIVLDNQRVACKVPNWHQRRQSAVPLHATVASFTMEVKPRLAKRPLVFNGRLANRGLTSLGRQTRRRGLSHRLEPTPIDQFRQSHTPHHTTLEQKCALFCSYVVYCGIMDSCIVELAGLVYSDWSLTNH